MKRPGSTPPFRTPTGEILPGSIAEIRYVRLGGLDQWVMIRGERVTNPLLLLLHGGPGFPEARLFRHFNSALEKSFTVVYWDQRGTNKSFDRRIPASSMTVAQFIADLDELVNAVSTRFGQRKVVIYWQVQGKWLGVLFGVVRGMPFWRFLRIMLAGPEASMLDVPRILRGMRFSQNTMWPEVSSLDLTTAVPALQMPVFFFLGRHDHVIDVDTSAAYVESLVAPSKRLVWFDESAHEPPFEEPSKFDRAMVELVRP